jgi:E2 ubiquitin ligase family protein
VSASLDFLKIVASEFRTTVMSEESDAFVVRFEAIRASGETEVFHLRIVDSGDIPRVYECEPQRLPTRCLDRHILGDGWFCLSWPPGEASEVRDETTARLFWSRVERFLQCQLAANALRRWPAQSNVRAHGDAAAYQDRAEELAAQFGPVVLQDVRLQRFKVALAAKPGRVRLELLRTGRRVARIHCKGGLVTTMTRCFCDEATANDVAIGACRNHAQIAPDLIRAIYLWHKKHEEFVQGLVASGYRCCGTLDVCEIRNAGAPLNEIQASPKSAA